MPTLCHIDKCEYNICDCHTSYSGIRELLLCVYEIGRYAMRKLVGKLLASLKRISDISDIFQLSNGFQLHDKKS